MNVPKIIVDIQDVVRQLTVEFCNSSQPITDDSQCLHKLCAKLEFLFTSSMKAKSLLKSQRHYWRWIHACLKNTKRLTDGLQHVQANHEIRGSKGRGRAFIRYCLVHQTLADTLQNCIMNDSVTHQYINSTSALLNPKHSSLLVEALYDLNTIHFDLNSNNFDLDSGWPTFASRRTRTASSLERWTFSSHVGRLESLTSNSVVAEAHRVPGSGSSGPHSVDQRVEELVLELDQCDQKIKEQEQIISDMESTAETLLQSTNEKQDILARVISDLESKNRHLHAAMSIMSSEFEERDLQWIEKHENITRELSKHETENDRLTAKVKQLEQDKRILEDLVSQQMSNITSNFAPNFTSTPLTPGISVPSHSHQATVSLHPQKLDANRLAANGEPRNKTTRSARTSIAHGHAANSPTLHALYLRLEEKESKIDALEQELQTLTDFHELYVENVKDALPVEFTNDDEVNETIESILKLREQAEASRESCCHCQNTAKVSSENNRLTANYATTHNHKLKEIEQQFDELKVEIESVRTRGAHRITEMEKQLSLTERQLETQHHHHSEMLADLTASQKALILAEKDLEVEHCREVETNHSF